MALVERLTGMDATDPSIHNSTIGSLATLHEKRRTATKKIKLIPK